MGYFPATEETLIKNGWDDSYWGIDYLIINLSNRWVERILTLLILIIDSKEVFLYLEKWVIPTQLIIPFNFYPFNF